MFLSIFYLLGELFTFTKCNSQKDNTLEINKKICSKKWGFLKFCITNMLLMHKKRTVSLSFTLICLLFSNTCNPCIHYNESFVIYEFVFIMLPKNLICRLIVRIFNISNTSKRTKAVVCCILPQVQQLRHLVRPELIVRRLHSINL